MNHDLRDLKICYDKLSNDLVNVDLHTESIIIDILCRGRVKPSTWRSTYFNPAMNLQDCVDLVNFIFGDELKSFRIDLKNGIYTSYVNSKEYSEKSKNAARSLLKSCCAIYIHSLEGL